LTSDQNPGNSLINTGVTNHLTPIGNILTNIKNMFCTRLGVVASIAEDGVSIKLNSSYFTDPESVKKVLYNYDIMRGTCLASYIMAQGLDNMTSVNLGQFIVVYFGPKDIATAMPAMEPEQNELPCTEQFFDAEMINIVKEDEDEELVDLTKQKLHEIFISKDKVKAAKQLEILVGQEMELPREFYFAGVKDVKGNESIALRWKYTKRAGKHQTTEITKSILNIYDDGSEGVFVGDFDKDSMFTLPDEVKTLIEHVLEFIGAKKTNDLCIYSLEDSKHTTNDDKKNKESNDKEFDDKESDKKDDKSDDKSNEEGDDKKDNEKSKDVRDLIKSY